MKTVLQKIARIAVLPALAAGGLLFTGATATALAQVGVDTGTSAGTEAEIDRSGVETSAEGDADARATVGRWQLNTGSTAPRRSESAETGTTPAASFTGTDRFGMSASRSRVRLFRGR